MRAIITHGLYTFYPIFEGQKRFLRNFFHKILTLCTVSMYSRAVLNQEWVIVTRIQYLFFILEFVRYLISLFVYLWMQSGDSSAEFWISSHTTPLPVPPQLYGNLFRMQGRKSPPHILSPTSSDTFLMSQNGVKASLDVTEMVFCCIFQPHFDT